MLFLKLSFKLVVTNTTANMNLTWKKNIASNTKLYENEKQIGSLEKENLFSNSVIGKIGTESYYFYKLNFFDSRIIISDITSKNQQFGTITFNIWNTRADIYIGNERYTWLYSNIWNTEWTIIEPNGKKVNFKSVILQGKITSDTQNQLLLLIGLFIHNYIQNSTYLVFLILFIPSLLRLYDKF